MMIVPDTSTSSKQVKVSLKQLNWKVTPLHMKHARRAGGSVWKGVPRFNVPQARFTDLFSKKPVTALEKVIALKILIIEWCWV